MTKEEARAWVDYQRDARIRALDERQERIDRGEVTEWAVPDPEPETSGRREVQPVERKEPAMTPATTDADWNAWCDGRIARAMQVQAANVDGLAKEVAADMNLLQSE